MAKKKVIWSVRAQQDRLEILEYWIKRNKSTTYSEKLFRLFKRAATIISLHPKIGKPTDIPNIRIKIVRDYLMIYQEQSTQVDILLIWDSRKNPNKLKKLIKKEDQ